MLNALSDRRRLVHDEENEYNMLNNNHKKSKAQIAKGAKRKLNFYN